MAIDSIKTQHDSSHLVSLDNAVSIGFEKIRITLSDPCIEISTTESRGRWIDLGKHGLRLFADQTLHGNNRSISARLENSGHGSLAIDTVEFEFCLSTSGIHMDRVYSQTQSMCGEVGVIPFEKQKASYACLGLTRSTGGFAFFLGFNDVRLSDYQVIAERISDEVIKVTASCRRHGTLLAAGATLELSDLVIAQHQSLSYSISEYAESSGQKMAARIPKKIKTGWCSWYYYYGFESESDILENASELKETPIADAIDVIQIDDGWNLQSNEHPRNWGDWQAGGKFPEGMAAVAKKIQGLGYEAGIWLAPFSVDSQSKLAQEHPDWLLKNNAQSELLEEGKHPVHGLDLTHPEVVEFIRATFRRVFREWGFDYIKIDFLMHAMQEGERYDKTLSREEAFHRAMSVIREEAGDRFILACGSPFGPCVGLVDAMRIGFDVGSRWEAPMLSEIWPHGNCSIKPAAFTTLFRQWMHQHWWQNDPDCIVARNKVNPYEPRQFTEKHPGGKVAVGDFGLNSEEAAFWIRLVWLTGSMRLLSERWSELSASRQAMVERCFEPQLQPIELLDFWGNPDVVAFRSEGARTIYGIFNMSEEPFTMPLPSGFQTHCCREYVEWLSRELFVLDANVASFPVVPAHGARIWVAE